MGVMKQFSRKLKGLREESSLNQAQMADRLKVSRGSISFYENGDRIPDIEFLARVSKEFNVSADWLIGESDVRSSEPKIKNICGYTGLSQKAVIQLHNLHQDKSYVNQLGITFINKFLDRYILRYEDYAWQSVFADIQAEKAKGHPYVIDYGLDGIAVSLDLLELLDDDTEFARWEDERNRRGKKLLEEAKKPNGEASSNIEISAFEYARFYLSRALKIVESVALSAIHDYKENVKSNLKLTDSNGKDE